VVEGIQAFQQQSAPKAGLMVLVAVGALAVNGLSAWLLHDATLVGSSPVEPSPMEGVDSTPCSSHHGDRHTHRHHGHGHARHHHGDRHAHFPPGDGRAHPRVGHRHDDHDAGGGPADVRSHESKKKLHGHALNLRGAWLHLAGDTLGALGALGAAIFIRCGGSPRADPIASFVVAGILLVGSVRLVRDATMVLLEAAPQHLPLQTVRRLIAEFPGVREIVELHVWTLGAGHDAITVRVSAEDADLTLGQRLSHRLRHACGAEYVTVQVEWEADAASAPVASETEAT
jgi:cation diffusion facilitator family transporter